MAKAAIQQCIHPLGESEESIDAVSAKSEVDTFAGKIHVFWDPHAQVTALGPVTFFIEVLKNSGLREKWVEDCPLHYTSRNSAKKEEILATVLLSVLERAKVLRPRHRAAR